MSAQRPLVIGNWKMNLDFVEAVHLGQQIGVLLKNRPAEHTDVVVAPPYVDLRSVTSIVASERIPISVGAQHLNANEGGAHTGEVSAAMLTRLGVEWVLVGHSERRSMYAMNDGVVEATLHTAVRNGFRAVLCVGEDGDVRARDGHEGFVRYQLESALHALDEKLRTQVTIAYEPVWAIGTGLTATSAQIASMTRFIRGVVRAVDMPDARVLYGGSVNADNASSIMVDGGVDGFLVGGASLKAESFLAIVQACDDCYAGKR